MRNAPASPPPLASRLGYGLVKPAFKVRQRYTEKLSEVGLAPNQHAILSTLGELGPCHQKALAQRVVLDPGDIVAYLDGLQKAGHIHRERDPADRRPRPHLSHLARQAPRSA